MVHRPHPPFTILCIRGEKEPHLLALAGSRVREARAATAFCGGKARDPFIMHADYVSMGGKIFFTPLFLPYIRSTLEVHFFDFILGRATPKKGRKKMSKGKRPVRALTRVKWLFVLYSPPLTPTLPSSPPLLYTLLDQIGCIF